MALVTCDGHVAARKNKFALLVHRPGEGRRLEARFVMALFATVEVRRPGELALVCVLVTARTAFEFHFEHGGFSSRYVAFSTGHRCMLLTKWEACLVVIHNREFGLLEAIDRVT